MSHMVLNKEEISKAVFWKYGERLSSQVINVVVQIVLARCLEPSLFGELAILLVFVNIATLFVQSGISTYIIQKEDLSKEDISTVLFVSLSMAVLMYAVLFFLSPSVEKYYGYYSLSKTLRVISISLIPSSFCAVYQGLLSRKMAFKTIFIRSMISIPFSGVVGVVLAKNGWGLWALVIQHLVNQLLTAIVLVIGFRQRIRFVPNWDRIKRIISFGGNVLIQSLLIQFIESIRTLLIGKVYSSEELAYYDKGTTYTSYIYSGVSLTLSGVLLPTLTKVQSNPEIMKKIAKRFLSISMFIVTPLLVGFSVTSTTWVPLLLTEKWIPSIPFIIIFALSKITGPMTTVNLQIYYSLGKVQLSRRIVSIECAFSLATLLLTYRISTTAIAWGYVIISVLDIFLFSIPNQKTINYSWKEQLFDFLPNGIGAIVMAVIVLFIGRLVINRILLLIIQVFVGIVVYLAFAVLIRNPSYIYVKGYLISLTKRKAKE